MAVRLEQFRQCRFGDRTGGNREDQWQRSHLLEVGLNHFVQPHGTDKASRGD